MIPELKARVRSSSNLRAISGQIACTNMLCPVTCCRSINTLFAALARLKIDAQHSPQLAFSELNQLREQRSQVVEIDA